MRPIQLRGATTNFRPHRLPAWAPPGHELFFNKKTMSEKKMAGPFSADELPTSLGVGLVSAGAIIIGFKAGSPLNYFLIGGGLAGLGYSIFNLFSGPTSSSSAPPSGAKQGEESGTTPPEKPEEIKGKIFKPYEGETLDSGKFKTQYALFNNSSDDVTVKYDVYGEIWSTGLPQLQWRGVVFTSEKTVSAGKQSEYLYEDIVTTPPPKINKLSEAFSQTLILRMYDKEGVAHEVDRVKFYIRY